MPAEHHRPDESWNQQEPVADHGETGDSHPGAHPLSIDGRLLEGVPEPEGSTFSCKDD